MLAYLGGLLGSVLSGGAISMFYETSVGQRCDCTAVPTLIVGVLLGFSLGLLVGLRQGERRYGRR